MRRTPARAAAAWSAVVLVLTCPFTPAPAAPPAGRPVRPAATGPATAPAVVLIHLPGIAGEMQIDRDLTGGLVAGGVAPEATIIDWTGPDRGVPALTNTDRHRAQAKLLAERLTALAASLPATPIVLTSHSAGTGVAVEALERLPPNVKIHTLVLLASALSPGYDLSNALRHVDGRCVSLYSQYDSLVLGTGTRTFGTYDRQHTDAAGYVGFKQPDTADAKQYAKLTQIPYDSAWMKLGNGGDHIGVTSRPFARRVLAPLITQPADHN